MAVAHAAQARERTTAIASPHRQVFTYPIRGKVLAKDRAAVVLEGRIIAITLLPTGVSN